MDARTLLAAVAETYAKLDSFEVEIVSTAESGDEDNFNRNTRRTRAMFAAPNKIRMEQSGRRGILMVSDGVDIHHFHRGPKHYFAGSVQPGQPLPGSFSPQQPSANGMTFLFSRIAENVAAAEMLDDGSEAQVVSVTYEPALRPSFIVSASPVTFRIDKRTKLVSRMEGEVIHSMPPDGDRLASRNTSEFAHAFVNETIPPQTFEYAPPVGVIDHANQRPGGGSSYNGPDEKKRFETWHYSNWEDDAFVDQFELKIRGLEINFERRVTFVDQNVNVEEKIVGPLGPTERELSIPYTDSSKSDSRSGSTS